MKKRLAIILLMAIVVFAVSFAACDDVHVHDLEHVEASAPTCTDAGVEEYWHCTDCNKYFSDALGTTEITTPKAVSALGHTLTHHDKVDATCIEEGAKEYWSCSVCEKNFADEQGQTELADIVISAIDHEWGEWTVTTPATCKEKGIETRVCSRDNTHTETRDIAIDENAHDFGEVSYVWATDYSTCTATRTCSRDADHVETETVNSVSTVTQQSSCTTDELTKYVATFENSAFAEQTKADIKTGETAHTYNKTVVQADYFASAATCTEKAKYYHSCECGAKGTTTFENGDALGHDIEGVALSHDDENHYYICKRTGCGAHVSETAHSFDEGSNFTATHGTWSCTKCVYTEQRVIWGQPITVNGQLVYTHVDNNQVGRYGSLVLDETKNAFYTSQIDTREFYSNTKNTSGNYIYKAVVNTACLDSESANPSPVVGFSITSGPVTIDVKSAWWEVNKLCINIAGHEISVTNFSHSLQSKNPSSTFTVTVKRVGNALYIYDVNNTLAVVLDATGAHAQSGHEIQNITENALTNVNSLLPQFFNAGTQNVCGPLAIGTPRVRVDFNISYTELYNVTGKVTLPADVTADLTKTRIVVESNGVYDTYTNVVNAQGEYSLVLPAGTVNVTFTNPAILGASLKDVAVSATNTTISDVQLESSNKSSSSVIINNMKIKMGADEADSSNVAVSTGATKEVVVANSVYGGEAKYNVSMAAKDAYQGLLSAGITDGNSIMRLSMRNGYVNKFEFEYCLVYVTKDGNYVSNYRSYMICASFLPSYYYGRTFTNSGEVPALENAEDLTFTFLKKADGSLELYYGEHLLITINANGFYLAEGVTCSNRENTDGRLNDAPQTGWVAYSKPEADFVTVGREYAVWGHVDGMSADVTYSIKASIEPVLPTTEE